MGSAIFLHPIWGLAFRELYRLHSAQGKQEGSDFLVWDLSVQSISGTASTLRSLQNPFLHMHASSTPTDT